MSIEKSCAFSGHRPHKLHFGYDEKHRDCMQLKLLLSLAINDMQRRGVMRFYTGMAEGVDLWAASYVLLLKAHFPALSLIAVIPHEGQEARFSADNRKLYQEVRAQCDEIVVLNPRYIAGCMQMRNQYMVDRSAHLIAVYNGRGGGTAQTIEYARSKNRHIHIIDPKNPSLPV